MKVKVKSLRLVVDSEVEIPVARCTNDADAARIAHALIGDRPVEHLIAILVDGRNRVTAVATLSQGGVHHLSVKVADVLRAVLVGQAAAFVLAHNHPSGDPEPSVHDVEMTRAIAEAARLVGVFLLDHVVVTAEGEHRAIPVD